MRTLFWWFSIALAAAAGAEEWSRFRGPGGAGVGAGAGYPAALDKSKNLAWRAAVRPGKSSPVLTRRHVFLTGYEEGKLYTQCFDRATGRLLWERSVPRRHDTLANRLNHPAGITPVTDGENVYAFFKDFGLVSYDAAGRERWRVPMGPFDNTMGLGASPVLAGGNVLVLADQMANSFLAAVDAANGELRWRTEREETDGWGSPVYYQPEGRRGAILTTSRGQFGVYDPVRGKRAATVRGLPTAIVGSPLVAGGVLYVQGYGSETPAPFGARLEKLDRNKDNRLSPDEYGDDPFLHGIGKYIGDRDGVITETEWNLKQKEVLGPNCLVAYRLEYTGNGELSPRELWRYDKNFTSVIPSPLVYDGVVYTVRNGGILTTLDARSGAVLGTSRIAGALGGYSASPVAGAGKVYLASEEGKVAILQAGGARDILSVADLGEGIFATPALAGGDLYIRTEAGLYRFSGRPVN
jgi:outer membrane protein assembly factor BamB